MWCFCYRNDGHCEGLSLSKRRISVVCLKAHTQGKSLGSFGVEARLSAALRSHEIKSSIGAKRECRKPGQ